MRRKIVPDLIDRPHPKAAGRVGSVPLDTSIVDAARRMEACNIAALAVVDGSRRLVGIITERDITRRVVGAGLDPATTLVAEVMSANPDRVQCHDTAYYALALMQAKHYRHLPVIDEDDRVLAMVSIRHLSEVVERELEEDLQARDAFIWGDTFGVRA